MVKVIRRPQSVHTQVLPKCDELALTGSCHPQYRPEVMAQPIVGMGPLNGAVPQPHQQQTYCGGVSKGVDKGNEGERLRTAALVAAPDTCFATWREIAESQ